MERILNILFRRKTLNSILFILVAAVIRELAALGASEEIIELCNKIQEQNPDNYLYYAAVIVEFVFGKGSFITLGVIIGLIILFVSLRIYEITHPKKDPPDVIVRSSDLKFIRIKKDVYQLLITFKNTGPVNARNFNYNGIVLGFDKKENLLLRYTVESRGDNLSVEAARKKDYYLEAVFNFEIPDKVARCMDIYILLKVNFTDDNKKKYVNFLSFYTVAETTMFYIYNGEKNKILKPILDEYLTNYNLPKY
ncbi:MAG: hypothetical protein ACRBG0_28195 [Lewinella sp.]|uniref:hypothetical protein n=1 Tax=Lewinella sp. TaxID=2004506 RepID=UPI003D6BEC38